jgi:3-dehydroquinate synthase
MRVAAREKVSAERPRAVVVAISHKYAIAATIARMTTIPVHIPAVAATTYDVRIGPGLLGTLGEAVRAVAPAPSAGLVSDSNVAPHYLAAAKASLEAAGYRVIPHTLPAGEQHKTFASVGAVLDTLLAAKVERATPVVALGGGVVGDLAGYVSASLLRGTPFVQVPTTLLAAVDASVGGKVGVDHPTGKNLIGAFHQPRLVLTDTATFKTLPPRELRCGLAECIKHGVIRDPALFAFIRDHIARLHACDLDAMTDLVARNVAIKAAVVHEDPFERGVRALLNLGHTFGHAIETVTDYAAVAHGEAVALGMVAAGRLAHGLGRFPADDLSALIGLIRAAGLPTALPTLDVDRAFATMFSDKKVKAGKLRFILPTRIGHAEIVTDLPDAPARAALASLRTA